MTPREYRIKRATLQNRIEQNKRLKCEHNVKHYTRELQKLEAEYQRTAGVELQTKEDCNGQG